MDGEQVFIEYSGGVVAARGVGVLDILWVELVFE